MYRQCVVLLHSACLAGDIQECRRAGDLALAAKRDRHIWHTLSHCECCTATVTQL